MKQNWEKEFENKWYLWDYSKKLDTYNTCGESVKHFIRKLLSQQKEEIMGEMDGLKKDGSEINYEEDNYASGYNKALEDILKAIEKL